MNQILLSFVGNRDPYADDETGPVLSLLQSRSFSRVVLFCNGSSYVERARSVHEAVAIDSPHTRFSYVSIDLESPIDYREIFHELKAAIDQLLPTFADVPHRLSVLLDPGTPQMQTAWFLLVASGHLDAELLQGVPPRFAGGAYKVRSVDLSHDLFPGITISRSDARPEVTRPAQTNAAAPSDGEWIQGSPATIVGASVGFSDVIDQARRVARYDVSVIIRGETGTGKEVVAHLIHDSSPRARRPFVAINCAAISAALAESEFFGHEKGAFTGADRSRLGQFRAADEGTVFLDEVGDLPLELQAKLLRVLEDGTVVPVGSDKPVRVNVRVLAATNRDLEEQIADGSFRRDLYERLANVTIRIPPLRERTDDIPLLLRHFVSRWNEQYGEQKGIGDDALALLLDYPWPGNVRELQNAVASICAMGHSPHIGAELLPRAILTHFDRPRSVAGAVTEIPPEGLDLRALLHDMEKSFYQDALVKTNGNAEQAARLLGINGAAFRKAARERLGIDSGE